MANIASLAAITTSGMTLLRSVSELTNGVLNYQPLDCVVMCTSTPGEIVFQYTEEQQFTSVTVHIGHGTGQGGDSTGMSVRVGDVQQAVFPGTTTAIQQVSLGQNCRGTKLAIRIDSSAGKYFREVVIDGQKYEAGFLLQALNGVTQAIRGAAKSSIPFFNGNKMTFLEAGQNGSYLTINDTGLLTWAGITAATTEKTGGVQIASQAETNAGNNALKVITPATLQNKLVLSGAITTQAGEEIPNNSMVSIYNVGGVMRARKADAVSGIAADGFVKAGGQIDAEVIVYTQGQLNMLSGLTTGQTYFVGAAGLVGNAPETGMVQPIGKAINATTIHFMRGEPVHLDA